MLSRSPGPAGRLRRRETRGWPFLISLALHLTVLLALLIVPSAQPPMTASDSLSVDVVMQDGPAAAPPGPPGPPAAAEAPAAPTAADAPVQQAETPPPTPPPPDVPPPPPVQQAETPPPPPPPPPVQQAETPPPTPAPEPDVQLPPPVQQAEISPPPPAPVPPPPAPVPVPPPPKPVAQVPPPPPQRVAARSPVNPAPPQRLAARPAATRASVNPAGAPAHGTDGQSAASAASSAANGAAWMGKLKQWWDQHSFYPKEASQTNEGGSVKVHIVIAPDGQVTSIAVVQGSGSSVLDAAALAVFRDAHLPPFPPGSLAQPADVVVTLHYHPAD